jgi:hypothetical protein
MEDRMGSKDLMESMVEKYNSVGRMYDCSTGLFESSIHCAKISSSSKHTGNAYLRQRVLN